LPVREPLGSPRRPLAAAIALIAMLASASACLDREPEPAAPATPAVESAPDRATPRDEVESSVERASLARGESLDGLLRRLGIDDVARLELVRALDGPLDLRRLVAGTGAAVRRTADGEILSVAVRPEAERFVRASRARDGWSVREVGVPVEIVVRTAGGTVASSVAQALSHERHAVPLVAAYSDVFQWDVDLFVDPRPGDRVGLVYEMRRVGATPADTPAFRDLPARQGQELGIGRILAASYDGTIASSRAFWVADGSDRGDYYDDDGKPLRKTFLRSPLNYRRISSRFSGGRMHPVLRRVVPHHGVDFAADAGTPVVAAADGRVISAGWDGPLGKAVRVRHGNGIETLYGHLRGFARGVRSGAEVRQNEVIGFVGATGRATGPHLHYTMRVHGRAIDPLRFDNPPAEELPDALRPELARALRTWTPVLASIRTDPDTRLARSGATAEDRWGG